MRAQIAMTDAEIEAAFDEIGHSTDIDIVAFTRETLDDFRAARAQWHEPGSTDTDDARALLIMRAQTHKGHPRRDVCVIDFGAVRGVSIL